MSIYSCIKLEIQPWMAWVSKNKKQFSGYCCPSLITNTTNLLPFQIISKGDYIKAEISPYGDESWSEIDLTIDTVISEGYFIHSYDGSALESALTCGAYDFRVSAGEMWYFEPILVEDFTISTNTFTARDIIMAGLKFSEQLLDGIPLIAPCDRFLPFMFSTENVTAGPPTVYLYELDGTLTELVGFSLTISEIDGKTYYIHDGGCLNEFLDCGTYRLKIVDGAFNYYSVWFNVITNISDIPDGNIVLRDYNGCVMRDEFGDILYESCT